MHIALNQVSIGEHLAGYRVPHEKLLKPLTKFSATLRPVDQTLIENDTHTQIPPFQGKPPAPPTIAYHMIGCCAANPVRRARPFRVFLGKFVSIPIFHPFPASPRRRDRVRTIGFPPSFLSG